MHKFPYLYRAVVIAAAGMMAGFVHGQQLLAAVSLPPAPGRSSSSGWSNAKVKRMAAKRRNVARARSHPRRKPARRWGR